MKNFYLFFIALILINCNNQNKESLIVKKYRDGKYVMKGSLSDISIVDSGAYCLVYVDSIQRIIDSSFYVNGVLNGYSLKIENNIYAEGEYKNGRKNGWFKYLMNGSVQRSSYFIQDTLVQVNILNSKTTDSILVIVPEIDMEFCVLTDSSGRKPQVHWVPFQHRDSVLIYLITALSMEDDCLISIKDDLNQFILENMEFRAPCLKFKVDNTVKRKYYLTMNVLNGGKLVNTKTDILMRTPIKL